MKANCCVVCDDPFVASKVARLLIVATCELHLIHQKCIKSKNVDGLTTYLCPCGESSSDIKTGTTFSYLKLKFDSDAARMNSIDSAVNPYPISELEIGNSTDRDKAELVVKVSFKSITILIILLPSI